MKNNIKNRLQFIQLHLYMLIPLFLLIVFFQNCSKSSYAFRESEGTLDLLSLSNESMLISTELNTSINFKLPYSTSAQKISLSVVQNTSNGHIEVLNNQSMELRYSPQFGFRGQDQAEVQLKDFYGNIKTFSVKISVGNPFSNIEPALAIRGMGCIQCHSNVSSDIVTDFGLGDTFYFSTNLGGSWWKSGGLYGDHGQNWHTMNLGTNTKVLVPKALLPSQIAGNQSIQWLDEYLKTQLARSSNPITASTPVLAKSGIFIGAPTSADLNHAFNLKSTERLKYFFDNSTGSPLKNLKGIADKGTYFTINGTIDCDGDLYLTGPLLAENLIVNTTKGCRIYVDGSIFLYGSINYTNSSDSNNLQLTSTTSINLGLGSVKKNNIYCDTQSHYYTNRSSSTYSKASSLHTRYLDIWTTPSQVTRTFNNPTELGKSIIAEAQIIETGEGKLLYDAECRDEGRNLAFKGLLLNAPYVHNRYKGDFKGTIIAETGLMSLGAFVFSFDPVFQKVPVLPFIKIDQILKVE